MAPSRAKSGRHPAGTSVTGEITAKRASVSNSTRMETSMKVCGPWTRNMDKVHTGEMKMPNSGESIPATGLKTRSMVEEPSFSKTVTDTMDTGSMECLKEKAEWFTQMEISMKANGMREREMVMAFLLREMEIILKVIGSMTSVKDKALISTVTKTSSLLESGLMINQRLEYIPKLRMKMLTKDQRSHSSKTHMCCHKFQNWS